VGTDRALVAEAQVTFSRSWPSKAEHRRATSGRPTPMDERDFVHCTHRLSMKRPATGVWRIGQDRPSLFSTLGKIWGVQTDVAGRTERV
jgi:hypothetical protein